MEFEEYYGEEYYEKMMKTVECLVTLTDKLKVENINADDLQPIVYYCHRIKRPESMQKKLIARGLPCTLDAAIHNVYDGVGFRIVCAFESDVHLIIDKLENCGLFKIDQKKDYISFPKPNGYRSIHLCIRNKDNGVLAEIQVTKCFSKRQQPRTNTKRKWSVKSRCSARDDQRNIWKRKMDSGWYFRSCFSGRRILRN